MNKSTEQVIFEMLTANTGTHMLDSGGDNGRNWQRNQGLTIDDFRNEPPATLNFYTRENDKGEIISAEPELSVSVFHKLTSGIIEQDELCREFNAMPCDDWEGDYYGTSKEQFRWLADNRFLPRDVSRSDFALWIIGKHDLNIGWNTYNWENQFSQVLQGTDLENDNGEQYVLIQIHGGADVRGGYTDAKLFKMADHCEHYAVILDDCGFGIKNPDIDGETPDIFTGQPHQDFITLNHRSGGEWTDSDGNLADDELFVQFAKLAAGKPVAGDQFNDF